MKSNITSFLSVILPLTILLALSQYLLQNKLYSDENFFYPVWTIYGFHLTVTVIIYFSVLNVNNALPDKTGFAFLAFSGIKILASIIFLIPLFQSNLQNPIPSVFSFFIPYFIYLLTEVLFVIKLLK